MFIQKGTDLGLSENICTDTMRQYIGQLQGITATPKAIAGGNHERIQKAEAD